MLPINVINHISACKVKYLLIPSIDRETNLCQNLTCFHDKNIRDCKDRGNIPSHNKSYIQELYGQYHPESREG